MQDCPRFKAAASTATESQSQDGFHGRALDP
jgi:hypothetical protein